MRPDSNNFKDLFREEELRFQTSQRGDDPIGSGIWRSLGLFKLVGSVVDMFIPKVLELIVAALGGDAGRLNGDDVYDTPPSQGDSTDPRNIKPTGPDEVDPPRGPEVV